MPFAMKALMALADSGWAIDLYLWEDETHRYRSTLPKNIEILTLNSFNESNVQRMNEPSRLNRIRNVKVLWEIRRQPQYLLVIGLGQIGIYIASLLAGGK